MMGERALRKGLEDCVLDIYGGVSAPVTADEAPLGTKLCRITKASGAVASTDRSTPRVYKISIPNATNGNTVKINVTVDGVGPTTYTYTIVNPPDTTDTKVAIKVARMLNDIAQLMAIADQDATGPAVLWVQGLIDGLDLTLADGGGTTTATVTAKQAAARVNTLYFGPSSGGIISKPGDVWSGVNLATGVASYFRFVLPWDSGILSAIDLRIQGLISTSGSDLDMSNTTLTMGATCTIDNYSLTLPMAA
jgi:hypothetical protein